MANSNYGVGSKRTLTFNAAEAAKDDGEFDYNISIPVETAQTNAANYWIRPIGGVVNQKGPFTFVIDANDSRYLLLNRAFLELRCKIVHEDDTLCKTYRDVVAPINMVGTCMWSSVEVYLNQMPFNSASSVFSSYKAYIETMLSYDSDARNTHLNAQFFHLDSPHHYESMTCELNALKEYFAKDILSGKLDRPDIPAEVRPGINALGQRVFQEPEDPLEAIFTDTITEAEYAEMEEGEEKKYKGRQMVYQRHFREKVPKAWSDIVEPKFSGDVNIGFKNRFVMTAGSHSWDMYVPITHDFFRLNNHISPGNKVEIKLTRHPDAFILNSFFGPAMKYKLRIEDMKLHFRTLERPDVSLIKIEQYLLNETQMHRQVVPAGTPSISFKMHHGGVLPKTVIVAMVDTRAADGSYLYNPFNFQHFDIGKISLMINGDEHPRGGLEMDFQQSDFPLISRAYHWMFENTGAEQADKGNIVSWQAFQAGCTIWPFDLTPGTVAYFFSSHPSA